VSSVQLQGFTIAQPVVSIIDEVNSSGDQSGSSGGSSSEFMPMWAMIVAAVGGLGLIVLMVFCLVKCCSTERQPDDKEQQPVTVVNIGRNVEAPDDKEVKDDSFSVTPITSLDDIPLENQPGIAPNAPSTGVVYISEVSQAPRSSQTNSTTGEIESSAHRRQILPPLPPPQQKTNSGTSSTPSQQLPVALSARQAVYSTPYDKPVESPHEFVDCEDREVGHGNDSEMTEDADTQGRLEFSIELNGSPDCNVPKNSTQATTHGAAKYGVRVFDYGDHGDWQDSTWSEGASTKVAFDELPPIRFNLPNQPMAI